MEHLKGNGRLFNPKDISMVNLLSFDMILTRSPNQTIGAINVDRNLVPSFILRRFDVE